MAQRERTAEGTERYYQTRERALARLRGLQKRNGFGEDDLVDLLVKFALDERKLEKKDIFDLVQAGQPKVSDEDVHFAEVTSEEMHLVPGQQRSNVEWLKFVAKGIARAREHWEEKQRNAATTHLAAQEATQETTSKPGTLEHAQDSDYRCFSKARAKGEPTFTLRAQDVSAPSLVREWVRRNGATCPVEKLADALAIVQSMERWPTKKAAD